MQHPLERSHPFGTAKLIRLGLPNSRLHTITGGFRRDLHCEVEVPDDAVLLYPADGAEDLAMLDDDAPPSALVVLDGTWAQSRQIYRANPWLQRLRHVRIEPTAPSRYRIRKEPAAHCLSTLEATVLALQELEPEATDFEPLLAAFDHMIDRQIDHTATNAHVVRRKRPRNRASRRIAAELHHPELVVLYAESSLPGGDHTLARELVQVAAVRLADGAQLELLVRPTSTMPAANHLRHMQLDLQDLRRGLSEDEARDQLREFVGAAPVAAWTESSLQWVSPLLPAAHPRAVLKASYCNVRQRGAGLLDAVVAREGLDLPMIACRGRARGRLANAAAVARWLRQQEPEPCT